MKELYHKKIIELVKTVNAKIALAKLNLKSYHLIEYEEFKRWVIVKVNNIDESCAIGDYKNKNQMKKDLIIRKFLMDNVPLTEKDLK